MHVIQEQLTNTTQTKKIIFMRGSSLRINYVSSYEES